MEHKHIIRHMSKILEMGENQGVKEGMIETQKELKQLYDKLIVGLEPDGIKKLDKTIEILEDYEEFKKLVKNLQENDITIKYSKKDRILNKKVDRERVELEINCINIYFRLVIYRKSWKITSMDESTLGLDRTISEKLFYLGDE